MFCTVQNGLCFGGAFDVFSNIVEAIEEELNMIAKYEDQVEVIKKYFKK